MNKGYRYTEIRNIYVGQLAHVWVMDSTEAIRTGVEKKIDSFAEGDLEHAAEILSALWKIANKEGNIGVPSSVSSNVSPLLPFFLMLRVGAHLK